MNKIASWIKNTALGKAVASFTATAILVGVPVVAVSANSQNNIEPQSTTSTISSIDNQAKEVNAVATDTESTVSESNKTPDSSSTIASKETSKTEPRTDSELRQAASEVLHNIKYVIINPDTGEWVDANDPNYEAYKKILGGDAGTVFPENSTAIKAALEKIKSSK